MVIVGLTGGIGMGKSTVAAAFRRLGTPVFDADAEVRRLQGPGGRALPAIARAFPGTVAGGRLDRAALRARVLADAAARRRLEAIVHPLVRAAQRRFLAQHRGRPLVVLDIPLLFETGADRRVDVAVTVSAPAAVQRARLRRRGTMPPADVDRMIAAQLPDAVRRAHADIVLRNGLGRRETTRAVTRLVGVLHGVPPAARGSAPGPRWGLRPQTPISEGFQGLALGGVQGQSPWPPEAT